MPYTFTPPAGVWLSPWVAPNWSGKTNTPTLDPVNLLTDPDLEGAYVAGLCSALTKSGSPTLTQDVITPHAGLSAQSFKAAVANNSVRYANVTPVVQKWYEFGIWGKRTAGATATAHATLDQVGGMPAQSTNLLPFDSAVYQLRRHVKRSASSASFVPYAILESGASGFSDYTVDDAYLRQVVENTMFGLRNMPGATVWKARYTYDMLGIAGVVAKANSESSPSSFLVAYYWYRSGVDLCYCVLDKYVNGVCVNLIATWTNQPGAGGGHAPLNTQWLEIRNPAGNVYQLFHKDVQIGTDQTVNDPEIINNTCGGVISTGGSQLEGFFCNDHSENFNMGAFGSSLTEAATTGHAALVKEWVMQTQPKYSVQWINQARSGTLPWNNLVRAPAEILSASKEIVVCDFRMATLTDYAGRQPMALEALIRKMWVANPQARIVAPIFPGCADPSIDVVSDLSAEDLADIALAAHYGVHLVDYRQEVINRIALGEHLSVYMADAVHQTDVGYALAASMEDAEIASHDLFSSEDHSVLPARVYDLDGYYENTVPQRKSGTDNDGTTGTWTTTGTRIESSEAGATVTFLTTCRSFGLYSAGVANTVGDVSMDGAPFVLNRTIGYNSYQLAVSDGPHTITVRVRAGVPIRIDEFWAI